MQVLALNRVLGLQDKKNGSMEFGFLSGSCLAHLTNMRNGIVRGIFYGTNYTVGTKLDKLSNAKHSSSSFCEESYGSQWDWSFIWRMTRPCCLSCCLGRTIILIIWGRVIYIKNKGQYSLTALPVQACLWLSLWPTIRAAMLWILWICKQIEWNLETDSE